jgi:sec-independent protein translocase protein TatA
MDRKGEQGDPSHQVDIGPASAYIGPMFGSIGPAELILIFIVALLVFGPKKLPEIGKSVGKAIREFKRTSEEIKSRIEDEIEASTIKDAAKDLKDEVTGIKDNLLKEPTKNDGEEGKKVS